MTARDPADTSTGWPAVHRMIADARRDRLETLRVAPMRRALEAERAMCDQMVTAILNDHDGSDPGCYVCHAVRIHTAHRKGTAP